MSVRDRQVRDAMRTRDRQVKQAMQDELKRLVDEAEGERWWGGHWSRANPQPMFCYSTRKITRGAEEGWASWVAVPLTPQPGRPHATFEVVEESYVLHRQRKQAKARAWNMWQGWRLARGLQVTWRDWA
jgi:hypothetical protein